MSFWISTYTARKVSKHHNIIRKSLTYIKRKEKKFWVPQTFSRYTQCDTKNYHFRLFYAILHHLAQKKKQRKFFNFFCYTFYEYMLANFFPYEIHSLEHIFSKKKFFLHVVTSEKLKLVTIAFKKLKRLKKNFKINFFCAWCAQINFYFFISLFIYWSL